MTWRALSISPYEELAVQRVLLCVRDPDRVLLLGQPVRVRAGRAVQVDPIKPTLKAPGTKRLKVKYDKPLSKFAFKFNLRRYTLVDNFSTVSSELKGGGSVGRCRLTPGRCRLTPGRCRLTPGRCRPTPGRCRLTPGRCRPTPGRCRLTLGRCRLTPGRCRLTPGYPRTTPS